MNTDQANKLPLSEVVERIGGRFSHKDAHGSLWYSSPFRDETSASFHITEVPNYKLGKIWVWKDFGDEGGTVVDLIVRKYNVGVAEALKILANDLGFGKQDLPPSPAPLLELMRTATELPKQQPQQPKAPSQTSQTKREATAVSFADARIEPLNNRALKGYLFGRGIDFWTAKLYVKEMHYTHEGKQYFALAFPNDLGSYELRNPYYQGVSGSKSITTLHPEKIRAGGAVLIFEGFMDFLSYLIWHRRQPDTPIIVLNSVEMKHEAAQALRELKAGALEVYPDNDDAGRKLISYLQENLPEVHIEDKSSLYSAYGYKDFNELLQAEKVKEKSHVQAR